jgi:hypothetical protein
MRRATIGKIKKSIVRTYNLEDFLIKRREKRVKTREIISLSFPVPVTSFPVISCDITSGDFR